MSTLHFPRRPGVALMLLSLVAIATAFAAFATNQIGVAMSAVIVTLVSSGVGMACLNDDGRRLRSGQRLRRR